MVFSQTGHSRLYNTLAQHTLSTSNDPSFPPNHALGIRQTYVCDNGKCYQGTQIRDQRSGY